MGDSFENRQPIGHHRHRG